MKAGRILLLLLCLTVVTFRVIADSPTCPASDLGSGCSDSDEWEGEFFPGIPKIKHEIEARDTGFGQPIRVHARALNHGGNLSLTKIDGKI